jgi:hypothetical protein
MNYKGGIMRKLFCLFTIVVVASGLFAKGSNPSKNIDTTRLVKLMQQEDWVHAAAEAKSLLNSKGESDFRKVAAIRYMYLMASAGEVVIGKKTFDELEQEANKFIGMKLMTPAYRIKVVDNGRSRTGNTINFMILEKDKPKEIFVTHANKKGTNIFAFVKAISSQPINFDKLKGNPSLCTGVLTKVDIHRSPMLIWIMRLTLKDAHVYPIPRLK